MIFDLAIIGGGPAGVAAGVYAARKRLRTVFITTDFNSQSSVSENIQNWIGTTSLSGLDLAQNLKKHLLAYADDVVDVKEGETAELIKKIGESASGGNFIVKTNAAEYATRTVLITSGSQRRKLEIPGAAEFDNKGLTYCASCDGPLFAGKDVVVIGGGNAAFETAAQLLAYAKSVTLLNRGNEFKADPITVENVGKHPNVKLVKNAIPVRVEGDKFVNAIVYKDAKTGKEIRLGVEGIFVEIGLIPNTYFVKDIIKLNKYGQIPIDHKTQMTEVRGIWAAGDNTDGLYHQNNIAAGDAVKALEDIYLHLRT